MDSGSNDFPANTSTTGLVESGWLDFGEISPAGDVDWFRVSLTAGVAYKFQIEAGTINGLFDPQLAIYSASNQLLATATVGQGFQSKYVEFTASTSGNYYLAASGASGLSGSYQLYVLSGTTASATPVTSTEISGTSGNDILASTPGNNSVDGGSGIDTMLYSSKAKANYTITPTSTGYTVTDNVGTDGTDTLTNVERLQFSNAKIALDISNNPNACFDLSGPANAGSVYRLYQAAFNRTPDQVGIAYWIGQGDASVSLTNIAAGFTGSVEFQNTYGNLADHQFVDQIYQNVLHRAGESAGTAYWYGQLDSHAQTRQQVLVGFSESTENQAAVIGVIQNGIDYTT
mgnify:CR=1 FL=1